MSIAKRGRLYRLRRRVPHRCPAVEARETVWVSLHTDSEMAARSKADRALIQMIEAWRPRLAGKSEDAEARHRAAHDLARAAGLSLSRCGGPVAKLPVEDVVERVEVVPAAGNWPDAIESAALLGSIPKSRITVSTDQG